MLVRLLYFFFSGLFDIHTTESTAAQIFAAKPLVGKYGNYSLTVQAQDRGFPPNSVTSQVDICVSDFNDHAPEFVSPSVNLTIRVPEVSMCQFVELTLTPSNKHKSENTVAECYTTYWSYSWL